MSTHPDRRDALKQLAGGALALASVACATGGAAGSTAAPAPSPTTSQFDMSWQQKVNKRRRMAFDTNEVQGGAGLSFVAAYLSGVRQAYGEPDASTVLVHRHASVQIVLGDEIWRRLGLGESLKLKDPTTGETAQRNPFLTWKEGDRYTMTGRNATLETIMKNGTIILACNVALSGYAGMLATKEKIDREQAKKEVLASVVPGVYIVPNGIFGVCAAQEVGCGVITVR